MLTGLDLEITIDFTLPNDVDNPTIFKLGMIPSDVLTRITEVKQDESQTEVLYRIVQYCVKGWENYNVPFAQEEKEIGERKIKFIPRSLLGRIDVKTLSALAMKCMEINRMTEGERKN